MLQFQIPIEAMVEYRTATFSCFQKIIANSNIGIQTDASFRRKNTYNIG
jgi:hypothetical protein